MRVVALLESKTAITVGPLAILAMGHRVTASTVNAALLCAAPNVQQPEHLRW